MQKLLSLLMLSFLLSFSSCSFNKILSEEQLLENSKTEVYITLPKNQMDILVLSIKNPDTSSVYGDYVIETWDDMGKGIVKETLPLEYFRYVQLVCPDSASKTTMCDSTRHQRVLYVHMDDIHPSAKKLTAVIRRWEYPRESRNGSKTWGPSWFTEIALEQNP